MDLRERGLAGAVACLPIVHVARPDRARPHLARVPARYDALRHLHLLEAHLFGCSLMDNYFRGGIVVVRKRITEFVCHPAGGCLRVFHRFRSHFHALHGPSRRATTPVLLLLPLLVPP